MVAMVLALVTAGVGPAAAATAGGATTDQVRDIETAFFVDNDQTMIANAVCKFVKRVEKPDGSAKETQNCDVTGLVTFPGFSPIGGALPRAFVATIDGCEWVSDYFLNTDGSEVWAESGFSTVTPSGKVNITSFYPADPLVC
jgi:hypothetical protein